MAKNVEILKDFLGDLTKYIKLSEPQTHKNLTIVPIILKETTELEFITIRGAENNDTGWIREHESASVSELEAINKNDIPMLIPFMQTIKGGKQDRTIYEPILVPAHRYEKNPLPIPSKCIEQGRWSFSSDLMFDGGNEFLHEERKRRFKSAKIRVNPSIMGNALRSLNPQEAIWDGVMTQMSVLGIGQSEIPTNSFIELSKTQKKKVEDYKIHFRDVEGQCGLAVIINNEIVGLEFYGSSKAWKEFREEIINGFAMEAIIRGDNEAKTPNDGYLEIVLHAFEDVVQMNFEEQPGTGLGTVIKFSSKDSKWAGITLVYENAFAHFYVTGKSKLPETERIMSGSLIRDLTRQTRLPPQRPVDFTQRQQL